MTVLNIFCTRLTSIKMIPKRHGKYFVCVSILLSLCDVNGEEKSSLTFVIDDTYSMSDDITQVKLGANAIFDTVLNSNESQIEDFVLVTFNDPESELRTITSDRNVFKNALSSINVHGGGDCPEYSISGIIQGIVNSKPGSTIYVFTDASASDYLQYNDAKMLAIKKQIRVVFVLTGLCGTKHSPDYMVYPSFAADTDGQVFHLGKQDIGEILSYVMENIKGRRTTLAAANFPPGTHKLNFTVDGGTKDSLVSASGYHAKLTVEGPDGSKVDTETIVNKTSISIVKLVDPNPGVHTVEVDSKSETSVIVSAITELKFQHGFSTFHPSSIKDTTTTPLPDVKSHITIQLTDGDVEVKTVKIIDMDDKLVKELPLAVFDNKNKLYITELEDMPDTMFKLAITAYDPENDETITRVGPPIAPQPKVPVKSKAPNVSIANAPKLNAEWNKSLRMNCKVTGYPQPYIVWMNKDSGEKLPSNVSIVEFPDGFVSILDIDKVRTTTNYECKATNPSGSDSKTIVVETTAKPYLNVLRKPTDTAINYNDKGELYCKVDAYPPVTITWYKDRKLLSKNDNLELSDDKSVLKIKKMNPSDDGSYVCEIRNGYTRKIFTALVTITGLDAPEIDKTITAIPIHLGLDTVIRCNVVKGYPKPKITWFYDDGSSEELQTLDKWNNSLTITIHNADKSDAGKYACLAENVVGNDYHEMELAVEYPPKIKRDSTEVSAVKGESVIMPCSAEGSPDPVVTWYKDNVPLTKGDDIYIYRDGSIRIKVGIDDSGIYTCNATNKLGVASRVVKVNVYVPVSITLPENSKMDIRVGSTLSLPCQAKGYPTPKTEWIYLSYDPSVPPKPLIKSLGSSTIKLIKMQLGEDGYYTCIASNSAGKTNLTYEIHVLAPPEIERIYTDKEFEAVEGDVVIMIKCNASGNPLPVIKWYNNDMKHLAARGDDVDIDNGTFILKNIKKDAEGVYICEATNSLGSDLKVYKVKVHKSPSSGHPTSTVTVNVGYSSAVKCDVPHKKTDQLRWYKNDKLIHTGELTINNAQTSDSGVYTCRVSNFVMSATGHTMVKVGHKPTFISDEEENIEYIEGAPYVLSCEANGEPEPKYTWWHNGEMMNTNESYHYFEMDLDNQGQYVCDATNEFGKIDRSFNVISKDCLLDIKKHLSKLQPLMVSPTLNWPHHAVKSGFMFIPKNDYVYLFCPNRFKKFPKPYVLAFCEGGTKFKINGHSYDYSNIECTEKMTHEIERTGENCFGANTELVRVVFKAVYETNVAYEVCLDTDSDKTIYTKLRMRSSVADVDYLESKWSDEDEIELNFDDAYDCDRQINDSSSALGRWFHRDDHCCFGKMQFVSPKDLLPGVAQRAAYSALNVVPHWSTCNVDSNNWKEVEQRVRTLAKATYSELVVLTGIAEDLTLPDSNKKAQGIFIKDRDNNQQAVSKYLWKVVQDPATKSSLVIIQVNVPDLLPSEAAAYVRCRDICNTTKWMKGLTWYNVNQGFTYCCSLKDFENSFGYRGVFDPYNRVLSDVSLIPEYSLT